MTVRQFDSSTQEILKQAEDEVTLLTFKEAQDYLRVSRATLYRLMWQGQLVGYKVGTHWRFYLKDLKACIK